MKRKIFSVLLALVLVLSFSLVMSVPNVVRANPGSLYVDDDATLDGTVSSCNGTSGQLIATAAAFAGYDEGDAVEFISGTADGWCTTIQTYTDNTTVVLAPAYGADFTDGTFNVVDLDAPSAGDAFKYIQSAITIAASGETVNVAAGQYTEDLTIATANITLKSASGNTTIQLVTGVGIDIQGTANNFILGGAAGHGFTIIGNSENTTTNIQTDNTTGVQISYNTINTVGSATKGIFVEGTVGATGLTVSQNNFIADTNDRAVNGSKLVNVTVADNIFPDPGSSSNISAMEFTGVTATSTSTISQNTITGYDGGIVIVSGGGGTSNLNISGNPISGCAKGIWFKQNAAGDITTVTVTQSVLTSNDIGIQIDLGANVLANQFTINYNNITGSTTWGLQNQNNLIVTAGDNWWGAITGPRAPDNSSAFGDEVSAKVDYTPWLDAAYPSVNQRDHNVQNTNTTEKFNSIQGAITDSDTGGGHTLVVLPGTYSENITVNKALTLMSATGSANTTIDASGLGANTVTIASANVTLGRVDAGFTITGANTTGLSGINLGGSSCTIDSNKVNNNYNGIRIAGSENHVRRNNITGNSNYGIYFVSNTIGEGWNEVHYNDITGNTECGAYADLRTGHPYWMQWAGFNWWGNEDGPGVVGPGTGDAVNQYVWYNPWLNDSYSTILAEGIANISMAIPLKTGWNTLSTPLALTGVGNANQWDQIVSSSNVTYNVNLLQAFTYDPDTPAWVPLEAGTTTVLEPLDAVFIKMASPGTVTLKVSIAPNPPPTKTLSQGWNLLGAAMAITERELEMWKVLKSVEQTYDGNAGYIMVVSPPLATQPPWVYVRGQEGDAGTEWADWQKMDFGRGYWIYMENIDEMAGFGSTPITARVWD